MAYLKVARISKKRALRYAHKARLYNDPQGRGKRLNLFAVVYRLRVNRTTFERRQRSGWPNLGGRAIEPLVIGTEETFLESEVIEALKPFRPTGQFAISSIEYYTFERTGEELGVTWQVLNSWAVDFPFWKKDTLVFQWLNSPETGMPVKACPVTQVNLAKEKLREAKTGRITLPDGKIYLSPKQRDRTWRIDGKSPPHANGLLVAEHRLPPLRREKKMRPCARTAKRKT